MYKTLKYKHFVWFISYNIYNINISGIIFC